MSHNDVQCYTSSNSVTSVNMMQWILKGVCGN